MSSSGSTDVSMKGLAMPEDMPASSKRGIPRAPFIEDIDLFLEGKQVELVLQGLNETYQKYKFMETSLSQQRARAKAKVPEMKESLEAVKALIRKSESESSDEPLELHYPLADNIYAKASIPGDEVKTVGLWMGANVMVEFPLSEADELLTKNLVAAEAQVRSLEEDLQFLKDQITTSEVNIARLYNWDVKQRRLAKGKGSS